MNERYPAFTTLLDDATPRLNALAAPDVSQPCAPGKWSAKETLGHLIDSAANNHGRFVRACTTDALVFPGYDQDAWVALQNYAAADWDALVTLWSAYNRRLAQLVEELPEAALYQPRPRHNLHQIAWQTIPEHIPTTLDYLIRDYIGHLQHHLEQIIGPLSVS